MTTENGGEEKKWEPGKKVYGDGKAFFRAYGDDVAQGFGPGERPPVGDRPSWAVDPKKDQGPGVPKGLEKIFETEDGLRIFSSGRAIIVALVDDRQVEVRAPDGQELLPTLFRVSPALRANRIVVGLARPEQPVGAYEATVAGSPAGKESARVYAELKKLRAAPGVASPLPRLKEVLIDAGLHLLDRLKRR